jgi:hypothetical protein
MSGNPVGPGNRFGQFVPYKRRRKGDKFEAETPQSKAKKELHVDETVLAAGLTKDEREDSWRQFCQACADCNT